MFVDAPLVVRNQAGQRLCETQVGQRYGKWRVSANTTNLRSPRLAGVRFLALAEACGWKYSDGSGGPPPRGRGPPGAHPYPPPRGAAGPRRPPPPPPAKPEPPPPSPAPWGRAGAPRRPP